MIIPWSRNITVHELIFNGLPYSSYSQLFASSKDALKDVIRLLKETSASILAKTSIYHPLTRSLGQHIAFYLGQQRNCCYLGEHKSLTREEIYALMLEDGIHITKEWFNELYTIEKNKQRKSYYTIHYKPGDILQFDWGTQVVHLNGRNQRVYYAVYVFPYSDYVFVHVTKRANGKCFVESLNALVQATGGLASSLLIDNMAIARKVAQTVGTAPQLTPLFAEIEAHYKLKISFCTPYRPNQKGTSENAVKLVKYAIENSTITEFHSFDEIQAFINTVVNSANAKEHPSKHDTRVHLFAHEQALFKPLPEEPYVYYQEVQRTVNKKNCIRHDRITYQVEPGYQDQKVTVRYNDHDRTVRSKDRVILATQKLEHGQIESTPAGSNKAEKTQSLPKWLQDIANLFAKHYLVIDQQKLTDPD